MNVYMGIPIYHDYTDKGPIATCSLAFRCSSFSSLAADFFSALVLLAYRA